MPTARTSSTTGQQPELRPLWFLEPTWPVLGLICPQSQRHLWLTCWCKPSLAGGREQVPLVPLAVNGCHSAPRPDWPCFLPGLFLVPVPVPRPLQGRGRYSWACLPVEHLPTALLWSGSRAQLPPITAASLAPPLGPGVSHTCSCPLSPVPQRRSVCEQISPWGLGSGVA